MMTIRQIEVTVGDITKGYVNNDEQGVRGYDGLLDIRPPYQREFIYNEKEQQAVIQTEQQVCPVGTVPYSDDYHIDNNGQHDTPVAIRTPCDIQWHKDIIGQPIGQRHVPSSPILCYITSQKRSVEVLCDDQSKHTSQSDSDTRIPTKVRIHLYRINQCGS